MRPPRHRISITRRQFLQRSGVTAAGVAAGFVGLAQHAVKAAAQTANPFAYDVSRFSRTDPRLVHYTELRRFSVPHPETRRIAMGGRNQLYLAAGKYVSVLQSDGTPLSDIALSEPARCVAVTSEGDVVVGVRDHVEVFDAKGRRRAVWESQGGRTWLTGVAISKTDVFLADAGNRIILRCDRSGKLLARIGEKNKMRNTPGFIVPSPFFDVALHPDGLLRVTNPGRHRVEAYTAEGDFELAWGKASAAIEGFCGCCNPIHIALLPDGRVVTCEKGLPRVKVYRADGTFESVVAGPESFPENAKVAAGDSLSDGTHGGVDAAVDAEGRIYILDLVKGDVRVMARKGDAPPATGEQSAGGA
jgi:hypothetical protein